MLKIENGMETSVNEAGWYHALELIYLEVIEDEHQPKNCNLSISKLYPCIWENWSKLQRIRENAED